MSIRTRNKKCKICKTFFYDDTRTNTKQVCFNKKCKDELNRRARRRFCKNQYVRKYKIPQKKRKDTWQKRYETSLKTNPSLISNINPSNPFLTDEEREQIHKRRTRYEQEPSGINPGMRSPVPPVMRPFVSAPLHPVRSAGNRPSPLVKNQVYLNLSLDLAKSCVYVSSMPRRSRVGPCAIIPEDQGGLPALVGMG